MLKWYIVSTQFKENSHRSYFESHSLPIHMLPLVVDKLKTIEEQEFLEHVSSGGSNCAWAFVVFTKTGDLGICADYKIGVNRKIYSDFFLYS